MTTEEKLQHFLEFCMKDARERSGAMLDEYTAALERDHERHKEDLRRRAGQRLQMEAEKIEREGNKRMSIEQINLKRTLSQKQEELKDKLFNQLKDRLERFMSQPAYGELLEEQILQAIEFAGDDGMVIYLDPADEGKVRPLAAKHHADIRVSQYSFLGGTRAVISSKNILIDNSFQTKLEDARQNFNLNRSEV